MEQDAMEQRLRALESQVALLTHQMRGVRRQLKDQDSWLDTVNSPWIKRVWWFLRGWRYHRLGRWYGKGD
jgi:hypothetical protein